MRKYCVLFAIVAVVSAVCLSEIRAEEPKDQNQAKQAAKDPNYRYFNGQWWYWMPQQKNWKVWNGTQWNDFQPQQTRTFSYNQEQAPGEFDQQSGLTENVGQGVTRLFGAPLRTVPENVGQTNQIIGSFGIRRAGSKMIGNY